MIVDQLIVHCSRCGTEYFLGSMPMPVMEMSAKLSAAKCKNCKGTAMLMGQCPRASTDIESWYTNGDTGTSSLVIAHVLHRPNKLFTNGTLKEDVPRDPADFGRCVRLLDLMPQWRALLPAVADVSPAWRAMVQHWSELEALYREEAPLGTAPKLYERLAKLRGEK